MFKLSRVFAAALACALLSAQALAAWPERAIRVVVPFPPGGGTDLIAREIVHEVSLATKWNFAVENRPGAGSNLGISVVASSAADGYTIGLGQTSNLSINPTLYTKMPYDSVKDLAPIGLMAGAPLVIVVASDSPYQSMTELIAAAKTNLLNFASPGSGTVSHLSNQMLQRMVGVEFMHIPYKGSNQAMLDLMGGRVDVYMSSVPTLLGHIRDGKARALAVTSRTRVADLPDVPTIAELGYPDYEALTWYGFVAPAGTPADIIATLNAEMNKALAQPRLMQIMKTQGAEILGGSAAQFGEFIAAEIERWAPVVKAAGARVD